MAKEFIEKNCSLPNLPVSEKMNCVVLERCSGDDCLRPYLNQGTSFLVNNGTTLYTAWHVAEQTSEAALIFGAQRLKHGTPTEVKDIYSRLVPEFVLIDHNEQIVYDTRVDKGTVYENVGDPLAVMYAMGIVEPDHLFGFLESVPKDFAGIRLSRPIGLGMQVARNESTSANCNFSASFSYNGIKSSFDFTGGNVISGIKNFKQRNLDLSQFLLKPLPMSVEQFKKESTSSILSQMGYSHSQIKSQQSKYKDELIRSSINTVLENQKRHLRDLKAFNPYTTFFTDQKIFPGGSGSPVVNDAGELVGLVNTALLEFDSHQRPIRSFGAGAVRLSSALSNGLRLR